MTYVDLADRQCVAKLVDNLLQTSTRLRTCRENQDRADAKAIARVCNVSSYSIYPHLMRVDSIRLSLGEK